MPSVLSAERRAALVRDLTDALGDRCSTNATQLEHHGHGESWHAPGQPDAVVFPLSTDEVSAVVRVAARHGAPVVPFGAGSSLEGHVNPVHGGVSLDLSRMNRVLRVSAEDLDATVEAGVTHRQLNKALANTGTAFWVDPGADATIGGMAATRASGTTAVRYGTMREVVLGLTVVLADGRVIRTGGRARKSSAGYDLTRLFVGSEGTLGVITEITVRLFGRPEAVSAAVCAFDSIDEAVRAVIQTIQFGIPVARIELMDEVQIDAVNRYSKLSYAVKPTLLFEFHATSDAGAAEHATAVQEIAAEHGGTEFRWATTTRIGPRCGRRATTPTTRRWRCAPAARHGSATCACRSPRWPSASWRPSASSRRRARTRRSSATSATATSTSTSCSTRTTRARWRK